MIFQPPRSNSKSVLVATKTETSVAPNRHSIEAPELISARTEDPVVEKPKEKPVEAEVPPVKSEKGNKIV